MASRRSQVRKWEKRGNGLEKWGGVRADGFGGGSARERKKEGKKGGEKLSSGC